MIPDPDDIFTRTLLEPATQELLARLPKAIPFNGGALHAAHVETQTGDCDGGHGEIANASALLRHLCEVLSVPLVDLVKTVEALPRWVPVESVKDGTVFYASARPPHFPSAVPTDDDGIPTELRMGAEWRIGLKGGYVLINGLYPRHPKVDP